MTLLSNLLLPLIVLIIIVYAIYKKVNVYDAFVEGAKESTTTALNLFFPILAMVLGINIFIKSGIIEYIFSFVAQIIKIPTSILPMAIMRPISGSSSLAILNNILSTNNPDSFTSILASIIQGSTDTTLYIITIYFGSIGIKKIRHALWIGLLTDLISIILSIIVDKLWFNF